MQWYGSLAGEFGEAGKSSCRTKAFSHCWLGVFGQHLAVVHSQKEAANNHAWGCAGWVREKEPEPPKLERTGYRPDSLAKFSSKWGPSTIPSSTHTIPVAMSLSRIIALQLAWRGMRAISQLSSVIVCDIAVWEHSFKVLGSALGLATVGQLSTGGRTKSRCRETRYDISSDFRKLKNFKASKVLDTQRHVTPRCEIRSSICLAERIFLSQRCYKCYTSDGWWCRRCQSKYKQIHDSFMTIENDYNAGRCVRDSGTCWVKFRFGFHCTWRCSWRRSSGLSPNSWSCRCSVWKYRK